MALRQNRTIMGLRGPRIALRAAVARAPPRAERPRCRAGIDPGRKVVQELKVPKTGTDRLNALPRRGRKTLLRRRGLAEGRLRSVLAVREMARGNGWVFEEIGNDWGPRSISGFAATDAKARGNSTPNGCMAPIRLL